MKRRRTKTLEFDQNYHGEWVRPVHRGYLLACCDCGVVHKMDFRVVDGRIEFRAQAVPEITDAFRAAPRSPKLGKSKAVRVAV